MDKAVALGRSWKSPVPQAQTAIIWAPAPANFELQTPNPGVLYDHRNLTTPAPDCLVFCVAGFGAKVDRIAIPSPTKWAIPETDYSDAIIIVIAIATSGEQGIEKGASLTISAAPFTARLRARFHQRSPSRALFAAGFGCYHRSDSTGRECSHCRRATWLASASTYYPFRKPLC